MRPGPLRLAFGALLLYVVAAWTLAGISPPEAKGADAPATEFSAMRALTHVAAIARTPHPVGSPAHEEVRAYLLGVLGGMGLETRVEDTSDGLKVAGVVYGARVRNVIGRLPGTRARSGPAILLAAHYDTVPQSLGASDDGSGVATLLETARALLAGPPLDHDVLFVFTDAEEIAACGALAFTDDELPSQPIAVALNFEARGTRGAVALYDTSTNNGALIEALAAAAVPRVVSTSLLATLARALPNDSDATLWKRAGIPTLAFAYVDHLYQYHRHTDSPEALDPRSLQHDGDYALPLVRYLGHHELPLPDSGPVTYFDLFGRTVVSYGAWTARLLALVTLAFFASLTARARAARPESLRPLRVALAMALAVGAVLASALAAGLVHGALFPLVGPFVLFAKPQVATVAGLAAGGAAFFFVYVRALRKGDMVRMVFGGLFLWALLLALTATFVPAASFVFQWPLLFALGGTAAWLRGEELSSSRLDLALVLALVPATFFWSCLSYTLFVMVGPSAPEVAVVAAAMPCLLGLPVLARIGPGGVRRLASVAAVSAAAIAVVGGAMIRKSPELPRPDMLAYWMENHVKTGQWSTDSPDHDDFVAQKIPAGSVSSKGGPVGDPKLPKADVTSVDEGALRHVTLTVTSQRQARCVRFWELNEEPIVKVLVNDRLVRDVVRFSPEMDRRLMGIWSGGSHLSAWVAEYCGAGADGFKYDLYTPSKKPIRMRLIELSDGLPGPLRPRGASDGYPTSDSDLTNVQVDLKL